ncbi:PASTA domain-containing protein [Kribbella shirazensis]|uniref:PASTA domain-containing protein n=1 Tax=Kribbella shirazensis TaxID=1105143 RepID=A0A7X5V8L2_9ACTN|nr:PASTA domain-containing protein [Kribbella shirazensis]NIK56619.1 hypothetical protein [Kribbella shirazensis]
MIEPKLTELLEDTADRTPVGPPPLIALRAGAARRRRRRTAGLTAVTVAAVGAVIAGTNLLASPTSTAPVTSPTPVPTTPTTPTTAAPVPFTTRLVGFGRAAIAIPASWPTNKSSCGTPQLDTVQIDDPTRGLFCMSYRPDAVESVELTGTPSIEFRADKTVVIDGVEAQRQRTKCLDGWQGTRVCVGAVGIPSLKVWFYAESSTSAEEVDRILSRIQILRGRAGVPSYWSVRGSTPGSPARSYEPLLLAAGLAVQYKAVKSPSYADGTILGVSPAVGTLLPVGSTVTVTVAG